MFPPNQHQCQGRGLTSKTFGGPVQHGGSFLENFKNKVPSWSVNQQTILNDGYVNKKERFLIKNGQCFKPFFTFRALTVPINYDYDY